MRLDEKFHACFYSVFSRDYQQQVINRSYDIDSECMEFYACYRYRGIYFIDFSALLGYLHSLF